jgi:putative ABC transport system permease protein
MILSRLFIKIISKNRQVYILQVVTLAIAFACTALITLFAFREFNYDTSFPDSKHLFRVLIKNNDPNYSGNRLSNKLSDDILQKLTSRKNGPATFTKIKTLKGLTISSPTKKIGQQLIHAVDTGFFSLFGIALLDTVSTPDPALSVFLSEGFSRELFGDTIPTRYTISIENEVGFVRYNVAGTFEAVASNTHEQWKVLIPLHSNIRSIGFDATDFSVYGRSAEHWDFPQGISIDTMSSIVLQSLPEIYFGHRVLGEEARHGDSYSILILVGITLLILILSVFNFVNLTTVVLPYRAKEIAVKKLSGCSEMALLFGFFRESFATTAFSCLLGIIALGSFSDVVEPILLFDIRQLILHGEASFYIIIACLVLMVSIAPVLITLRFIRSSPNRLLSTDTITFPKFKRVITLVQFALSIFLLISSIVVGRQIQYSLIKEPGRNHEQIVYLRYPWTLTPEGLRHLQETWKVTNPHIVHLMATSQLPHLVNSKQIGTEYFFSSVDPAFNQFFNLEITSGRWFKPNDRDSSCVINTIAARMTKDRRNVIGVFKDINGQFNQPAKPLKLIVSSAYPYNYLCIRVLEVDIRETIKMLSRFFSIPETDIHFLDQGFARWMDYQDQLNRFSKILTVMSMILSCCCVYGLGLSLLQEKHKQITIHKMFGASISNITFILLRTFTRDLVLAVVIVVPVTFLVLQEFLRTFVYVTPFQWTDTAYPVAFCLIIVSGLCFYHASVLNRVSLSESLRG